MNITPPETILFAKFSLLCRACDEIVASRTLELLFEATSSFDMAVNSLILFLKFVGHGNLESYRKYLDYFNILGKKFNTYDQKFSFLKSPGI